MDAEPQPAGGYGLCSSLQMLIIQMLIIRLLRCLYIRRRQGVSFYTGSNTGKYRLDFMLPP